MKRVSISLEDESMLQAAKYEARDQGISFSEYVTSLIGLDLQLKLQYKIKAFYDNGSVMEETNFYTYHDLDESIQAYNSILNDDKPLPYFKPEIVKLAAFEVWQHGRMVVRKEKANNGKEEF